MKRNIRILLIAILVFFLLFVSRFAYKFAESADSYHVGVFAGLAVSLLAVLGIAFFALRIYDRIKDKSPAPDPARVEEK
ncbi:MAG: hypothetical protein JXM71_06220 [Spirochaetales bacterium]|nr:hypothetical protein [Spirochaetales bacterium]